MPEWLRDIKSWFLIALVNFLIVALTGIIMRYVFVNENLVLPYRNILQAHSHLAILGWVFVANFCLLFANIRNKATLEHSESLAMIFAQISVIAMFVSFLFFGYNSLTIFFLTTHMIAAFWLLVRYMKQETFRAKPKSYRTLWISASFFFLVLSFLSPFLLGYISISGGKGTALYYAAVQFFLHFQFNGWLLFVVFGLIWDIIEQKNISLNHHYMKWGYRLLVISCFFTFALAVAWSTPHPLIYLINSLGVVIQLIAAILLSLAFYSKIKTIKEKLERITYYIFCTIMSFFLIKIIVQSAVVIPDIAVIAYTIRNYILAFIHLLLLGVISTAIIGIAHHYNLINLNHSLSRKAIIVFGVGFLFTELLLFVQGTMQWASMGFMKFFHELMLGGSILLAVGITLLLISQKNNNTEPLLIKR